MADLVPYSQKYREVILKLLDDVPFKHLIWDWQFEDPAVCSNFDPVVLVDEDQVLAFNGVMPAPVKYEDCYVDALWSCDFYVAANCRGQGLGRQVKEALTDKAPVVMSFGVSSSAAMVLEHMGWRLSPEAESYRYQRRLRSTRDLGLMLIQGFNWLRGRGREDYEGELEWVNILPPQREVDELWEYVVEGYRKIVCRNFSYLDWKYQRHPLAQYEFLEARTEAGELEALLIVRTQKDLVRIVDWLGPANAPALKRAMIKECRHGFADATNFTVTTTDQELGKALCDVGFFRTRTRPSFFVRSALPGDRHWECGWFLMTGDSDGELLSAAKDSFVQGEGL